jgi:hypothetical protein
MKDPRKFGTLEKDTRSAKRFVVWRFLLWCWPVGAASRGRCAGVRVYRVLDSGLGIQLEPNRAQPARQSGWFRAEQGTTPSTWPPTWLWATQPVETFSAIIASGDASGARSLLLASPGHTSEVPKRKVNNQQPNRT